MIGMLIILLLADKASLLSMVPQVKRPEALAERSQELIHTLGYSQPPVDSAYGYRDTDFLGHLRTKVTDANHWDQLKSGEPPAFVFWYRQSPAYLTQSDFQLGGRIERNSPPQIMPGMVGIQLDPAGRLVEFDAVPLRLTDPSGGQEKPDWKTLFEEAGFDLAKFRQVPPRYITPVFADLRMAWEGTYAQRNDIPIHVEAASAFGKLVYFQIFEPWGLPGMEQLPAGMGNRVADIIRAIHLCGVLAGALFLAWRNLRLNRGDRCGAFRISVFVFFFESSSLVLRAYFAPDFYEISSLLFRLACRALMSGMLIWIGYIALEPHVRRWWASRPSTPIS